MEALKSLKCFSPTSLFPGFKGIKAIPMRSYYVFHPDDNDFEHPPRWGRPKPSYLVTHLDASTNGKLGGAVAWVTWDYFGKVVDQGEKWFAGEVDITQLELSALKWYTSTKRIYSEGQLTAIYSDSAPSLLHLKECQANTYKRHGSFECRALAHKINKQLNDNFLSNVKVSYIKREMNHLANHMANRLRVVNWEAKRLAEEYTKDVHTAEGEDDDWAIALYDDDSPAEEDKRRHR